MNPWFHFLYQEAVAVGFEEEQARFGTPECYFTALADELQPKRDQLAKYLMDIGMVPTIPEGGYFMMADYSSLSNSMQIFIVQDFIMIVIPIPPPMLFYIILYNKRD